MNCNNLNKTTIQAIFLKIVKAWEYSKCNNPNSFASVSGNHSVYLNHPTFNKSTRDYKNGEFWTRNWEQAGSDINTMKREFPAVLFENVTKTIPEVDSTKECRKYGIDVIAKYDCEECKGCNRTSDQVSCDTDEILDCIFDTFKEFTLYDDGNGNKVWLHPTEGDALGYESEGETIVDNITDEPIEHFEISLKPNIIGWALRFEICTCRDKAVKAWTWDKDNIKAKGEIECDVC